MTDDTIFKNYIPEGIDGPEADLGGSTDPNNPIGSPGNTSIYYGQNGQLIALRRNLDRITVTRGANSATMDADKGLLATLLNIGSGNLTVDASGYTTIKSAQVAGVLSLSGMLQLKPYLVASLPAVNTAATGVDDNSVGSIAWTNPNLAVAYTGFSAFANDASGASVQTHYLKVTGFGLAVPATATILGIEVEIDRNAAVTGNCKDTVVKLVKADGTLGSENKADTATNWPTTINQIKTYGGPNDLWSDRWSPADVNDADFGAVLSITFTNAGATFPSVYLIRVNVYYTGGTIPVKQGSLAHAINGRKNGEGAGLGTGVLVFHDGRAWKASDTGATVAA